MFNSGRNAFSSPIPHPPSPITSRRAVRSVYLWRTILESPPHTASASAMNLLQGFVLSTSGVMAAIIAAIVAFQENLIYHPNIPAREYEENPADHAMPYDDVELVTQDGVRLHAWLVRRTDSKSAPTFIYFHGNTSSNCIFYPQTQFRHERQASRVVVCSSLLQR